MWVTVWICFSPSRPAVITGHWVKLMATTSASSTDRRPIRRLRSKSDTPYLVEARLSFNLRTGKDTYPCPALKSDDRFGYLCQKSGWMDRGAISLKYPRFTQIEMAGCRWPRGLVLQFHSEVQYYNYLFIYLFVLLMNGCRNSWKAGGSVTEMLCNFEH